MESGHFWGKILLLYTILDLIANLALLVALSNLSGFVGTHEKKRYANAIQGFLFGLIAVFGMLRPVAFQPGIIFDGRSVVLSLCAFFFGPLAALIAGSMAAAIRLLQGGAGAATGVWVILASVLWGLAFRFRLKGKEGTWRDVLGMGLAVHISMLLILLLTLPKESAMVAVGKVGLPVLLLYPVVTLIIAQVLLGHLNAGKIRALEGSLQESEAWHKAILQTTLDGFLVVAQDGKILQVNNQYLAMSGYGREEILKMRVSDLEALETESETTARIREFYRGKSDRFETKHYRKDGSILDVEVSIQIVQTNGGPRLVSFLRDITRRKKVQAQAHAHQQRLAEAQKLAHLGSWELNLPNKTLRLSHEANRILGLASGSKDVAFERFLGRVHLDDLKNVEAAFAVAIAQCKSFHVMHRLLLPAAKGAPEQVRHVMTRGRMICDEGGKSLQALGTIQDITELKLAEEQLLESEVRLKALADHLPGGMVYQLDTGEDGQDFRFTYISAGVEAIHGVSAEAALADPTLLRNQILEEDRDCLAREEGDAVQSLSTSHLEMRIRKPSGEIRWVYVSSSPRRLANNHLVWDGLEIDITDRKKSEENQRELSLQLQQAQKMESLGSLAGGVAHDINNVLGAILSLASVLRTSFVPPDPTASALDTIVKACTRGRDVVRSLLIFARRDLEEEKTVNLNTLVLDTAQLLAHTTLKRAEMETDLDAELPDILGDFGALSHALINLCVNAMDAMPTGGRILVKTRKSECGGVLLSVKDTGTGMSLEVIEKAMEPFFTTKPQGKGTGLGLSMVYGTMKAHQGQVRLSSVVGEGTEVELMFPASRVMASRILERTEEEVAPRIRGYRILLVDDDELVLNSVSTLLNLLGHEVHPASGGAQALDLLQKGLDAELVILDMNMPEMSGAEALPKLRELQPNVPVIMASGYLDPSASRLIHRYTNLEIIDKPFTVTELRKAISRQMKET